MVAGGGGVAGECCGITVETGDCGGVFAEFVVHWEEVFDLEALEEDACSGEVIGSDS